MRICYENRHFCRGCKGPEAPFVKALKTLLTVLVGCALAECVVGCASRPTKPLVLTEQVGALPVEFTAANCQIPILSALPASPHEVIARVKTYGNQGTGMEAMQKALHREACAIGAEAIVLQRVKAGEFQDEVTVQHMGASSVRDYRSRADYEFQLVGLAIRYTQ